MAEWTIIKYILYVMLLLLGALWAGVLAEALT